LSKLKTKFFCQECGQESTRWLGRCPGCGAWNSMVEELVEKPALKHRSKGAAIVAPLSQIEAEEGQRLDTGGSELNRVFGGGVVSGSFVLLSGEPGIGKSTLFLQMADFFSRQADVLYVSGEESPRQIKLRADRMRLGSSRLHILAENSLNAIRDIVLRHNYRMLFIDSIQTMVLEELQSAPGSISQIREGAAYLLRLAKENEITVFLVGHVTKEGMIGGPKVLEHIVDTVLYFEGDQHHLFRLLRVVKNRFGPANEIGVFEMRGDGLKEIANPSLIFMGDNFQTAPGSAIAVLLEGTRPLMVEIQSLVSSSVFTPPRRTVNGMDYHRLLMLLAVLDKRAGCSLAQRDVFINIAGGLQITEPAADLAVIAAILSGLKEKPLHKAAFIGELGLTGEIRGVSQIDQRLKEAEKFGFQKIIIPEANSRNLVSKNTAIYPVKTIGQFLEVIS